jgi:hypothetical protein
MEGDQLSLKFMTSCADRFGEFCNERQLLADPCKYTPTPDSHSWQPQLATITLEGDRWCHFYNRRLQDVWNHCYCASADEQMMLLTNVRKIQDSCYFVM